MGQGLEIPRCTPSVDPRSDEVSPGRTARLDRRSRRPHPWSDSGKVDHRGERAPNDLQHEPQRAVGADSSEVGIGAASGIHYPVDRQAEDERNDRQDDELRSADHGEQFPTGRHPSLGGDRPLARACGEGVVRDLQRWRPRLIPAMTADERPPKRQPDASRRAAASAGAYRPTWSLSPPLLRCCWCFAAVAAETPALAPGVRAVLGHLPQALDGRPAGVDLRDPVAPEDLCSLRRGQLHPGHGAQHERDSDARPRTDVEAKSEYHREGHGSDETSRPHLATRQRPLRVCPSALHRRRQPAPIEPPRSRRHAPHSARLRSNPK